MSVIGNAICTSSCWRVQINKGNIRLFWICKGRESTQWSDVRKLLVLGVFCDTCIPITFFHLNSRTKFINRSLKYFQCKKNGGCHIKKRYCTYFYFLFHDQLFFIINGLVGLLRKSAQSSGNKKLGMKPKNEWYKLT